MYYKNQISSRFYDVLCPMGRVSSAYYKVGNIVFWIGFPPTIRLRPVSHSFTCAFWMRCSHRGDIAFGNEGSSSKNTAFN